MNHVPGAANLCFFRFRPHQWSHNLKIFTRLLENLLQFLHLVRNAVGFPVLFQFPGRVASRAAVLFQSPAAATEKVSNTSLKECERHALEFDRGKERDVSKYATAGISASFKRH